MELHSRANPDDVRYVTPGATMWLRSGSPTLTVLSIQSDQADVSWISLNGIRRRELPIACLTPEISPVDRRG